MRQYQTTLILGLMTTFLLATSCQTTSYVGDTTQKVPERDEVKTKNLQNLALVDYLRRVPGLSVSSHGGDVDVMIRGLSTVYGDNNPLYVIDNDPIGNDYTQAASLVDTNDISSVTVLKDANSTTNYGSRGSNGVIVIKTKKRQKANS